MLREKALDLLENAIKDIRGKSPENFNENLTLSKDLGLESIDIVDLFFELEQKTNLKFDFTQIMYDNEKATSLRFNQLTVKNIVDHLVTKSE